MKQKTALELLAEYGPQLEAAQLEELQAQIFRGDTDGALRELTRIVMGGASR